MFSTTKTEAMLWFPWKQNRDTRPMTDKFPTGSDDVCSFIQYGRSPDG